MSEPAIHIYAPRPTAAKAITDSNCPAKARDGRLCGGRRALAKFTPWHGWEITCIHCGARWDGDEGERLRGRGDVTKAKAEWVRAAETPTEPLGDSL